MADKKISALTGATTPLAGTEVLPIVQSGATVKVANNDLRPKQIQSNATSGVLQVAGPASAATRVMTTPDANFTAARTDAAQSFTGDQTFATGNLIIGTSGKGIDFSATSHPAGMTSELLADYEEGTWTPTIAFTTNGDLAITYSIQTGTYTKVGRQVTVSFYVSASSFTHTTASGVLRITGSPFNAGSSSPHTATTSFVQGITKANYTSFGFYSNSGSGDLTSAACGSGQGVDNITAANVPSGGLPLIVCTLTYFV